MDRTYCVYKNKKYSFQVEGEMIKIITHEHEEGFENYIGYTGYISKNLFSKLVSQDELDVICSVTHEFKYKDKYFRSARSIDQWVIEKNSIILSTLDEQIAKELDFKKIERFVFEKEVNLDDITEIMITLEPLFQFKKRGIEKIVISKHKIKQYIEKQIYRKHHRMEKIYCIYKGKKYYFESSKEMIEIISDKYEKGFKNYIDITGKMHKNYFSKLISIGELDEIYLEKYRVRYKNMYFEILAFNQKIIVNNKITLFTDNIEIAKKLNFDMYRWPQYLKEVNFDDIKELVITREPLEEYKEKFNNIDTKKIVKSKEEIKEYIREYLKREVPM